MKVVGASDVSGAIVNPDGLNIPEILRFLDGGKRLLGNYNANGVTHISNSDLLEMKVDVLIPAALENQINDKNANCIQAKYVVEAANGPTTLEADEILKKRGVVLVPDILANAAALWFLISNGLQNNSGAVLDRGSRQRGTQEYHGYCL